MIRRSLLKKLLMSSLTLLPFSSLGWRSARRGGCGGRRRKTHNNHKDIGNDAVVREIRDGVRDFLPWYSPVHVGDILHLDSPNQGMVYFKVLKTYHEPVFSSATMVKFTTDLNLR